MRKAVIEIETGSPYFRVSLQENGVCHSPKLLEPQEFRKLLDGNLDSRFSVDISPILDQTGCIRYIKLTRGLERRDVAFFVVEKARFDYNYVGQVFKDVGMPKMLFAFETQGDRLVDSHLYCIKDCIVTDDTVLCWFPFANVSDSICWGDFGAVQADQIFKLRGLPYQFISLEHNDHLFGANKNSQGLLQRPLLDSMKERDFDDSLLVSAHMSFLDFCKNLNLK